jgi:phosphoenolpyruvate carboxykinase (ATP)
MDYASALEKKLGLKSVTYKYGLSKDELFREAIEHDRGRVRRNGPDDAQKAC